MVCDDDYECLLDFRDDPHDLHDLSEDPKWQYVQEKQRQRIIDWMAAYDDPDVVNGELNPIPGDFDPAWARASSNWNSRGRH